MRQLFLIMILAFCANGFAQTSDSLIVLGKRQFLDSPLLGERREYWIYLPPSYLNPESQSHRYPVLYLLDGDTYFIPTAGIVDDLGWCLAIPEMIIVAIIHPDRMADLLPAHTDLDRFARKSEALKNSGHADNFLNFLNTELFPTIDKKYRTMPYRILIGHSSAGLTALYALQRDQSLFNAYVAIDPGALDKNEFVMNQFGSFLGKNELSTRKLFISSANNESPDEPWDEVMRANKVMLSSLQSDKHSRIDWKHNYYPHDNHISLYVNSFYDAMRFIFRSYTINSMRDRFRPRLIINQFDHFSKETGVKFIPPEYVLNRLGLEVSGYYPMVPGGLDAAIEYFQTNLNNFPKSVPSLLNLGETYLKKGNQKQALLCFSKVLEIEPQNEFARRKVAETR